MSIDRLAEQYTGAVARDYDARRLGTPKWEAEQAIVESLLASLPAGATLLDIPVGTGRFLPSYERLGVVATGIDASPDMLARAREKSATIALRLGDIRRIEAPDAAYDCTVCIRFLNWVDVHGLSQAVRELARVSREHVVVGVRSYVPLASRAVASRLRYFLKRWQTPEQGPIVVHTREQVLGAFREAGLGIRWSSCVEASGDGTEYYIYHLHKG